MAFERIWHKRYPPGVPAELVFDRRTMPEFLTRASERYPSRAAINYMGKLISFQELEGLVNRFAMALMDIGVKKGDKVAMLLPNIPQIVIANFATFRIGGVTAMNNPLYTERELLHQLNDAEAKVLITLDLLFPKVLNVWPETGIETVIVCHINDYLPFPKKQLFPIVKKQMFRRVETRANVHEFMDLMNRYPPDPVKNAARWEDLGALLYTGGTTGVSKGAMLTHANLSSNVQQTRQFLPDFIDGAEQGLAIFPFFHSAGFTGVQNMCIYAGWTNILVPRPEPGIIIDLLKKYRPTLVPGVPTIFVGLLNHPKFHTLDLSCIKGFVAGAAPLTSDTIAKLKALTGAGIANIYGLTETSPMGTILHAGVTDKPGSVGLPLPNTDVKLVDINDDTLTVACGQPGEVCFKGPQVMLGYYNKPDETDKVIKEGWLLTGDIGIMDDEGFLFIVDRKKDMIIAGGFNIYPNEIDEILTTHPKILEACTIGVPDEYRGETVKSFVVVTPGETLSITEIDEWCRERLSAFKVPRQIAFMDSLPKSAVGKILRKELRKVK